MAGFFLMKPKTPLRTRGYVSGYDVSSDLLFQGSLTCYGAFIGSFDVVLYQH